MDISFSGKVTQEKVGLLVDPVLMYLFVIINFYLLEKI